MNNEIIEQEKTKDEIQSLRSRGEGVSFTRIRRVCGYLSSDPSNWNDAKQAELRDRTDHYL